MKTGLGIIIFISFFSFSCNFSWAFEKTKKKQASRDSLIRSKMNNISKIIRDLGPFIASDKEFNKEKNKKVIVRKLSDLTKLFKNLKNHQEILGQGLLFNQKIMADQLEQVVVLFSANKKTQSHVKFSAALNLCIGCHTQSPGREIAKLFPDKDIEKMKLNTFEKAELYFISRDYEKAIKLYDDFLLKSKKTDDDEFIYKAFERELTYFIRIKKDFNEGNVHFNKLLKSQNFNNRITQEITEWAKVLSGKNLWENYNPETIKEEEMEKFMKGFIADDDDGPIFTMSNSSEVYDQNLAGILLDYYNAHPDTKHGAKILYWLAVLDKRINDDLFFSLGDFYLSSCMEKYSKDPQAKDCYDFYEENLANNYISKKKKEFPKEIKARLDEYKKLINYDEIN